MEHGTIESYLFLDCKDENQALQIKVDDYNEPITELLSMFQVTGKRSRLMLKFRWNEVYSDLNSDLEKFAEMIKEKYNLEISGYVLSEIEGNRYRGEFHGLKMQYRELDWLHSFTLTQIDAIRSFAEKTFKEPQDNIEQVELYCPKCNQKRIVTAEADSMNYLRIPVFSDPSGNCNLDWENLDAECDFSYHCDFCGETLAMGLCEVEEKLEAERHLK